jgi:hypothetical protein
MIIMTTMDENFIKDLMDEVRKVQDMCDAALRDGDYIKAARFGDMASGMIHFIQRFEDYLDG